MPKKSAPSSLWLTLLCDLEPLLAAQHHSLQHLMGRHVGLEVARVPQLADQLPKALHQQELLVAGWALDLAVVLFPQEVVPQWCHVREWLRTVTMLGNNGSHPFACSGLLSEQWGLVTAGYNDCYSWFPQGSNQNFQWKKSSIRQHRIQNCCTWGFVYILSMSSSYLNHQACMCMYWKRQMLHSALWCWCFCLEPQQSKKYS